jgi:curved DNA-binding protein CbpA
MAEAVVIEDYYAILEVSQFASLESIRESYKRLALKFHPDKNRNESATSDFQLLVEAWETLRNKVKRSEYDRKYAKIPKRMRKEAAEEGVEMSRGQEERDMETSWSWAKEGIPVSELNVFEQTRRKAGRAWQEIAREDYLSRSRAWIDFRRQHVTGILDVQQKLHQQQADLAAHTDQSEAESIRRFQDAIERSCSLGHQIENHAFIMRKLMEARRSYVLRLSKDVAESQVQLKNLILELENERQRYEEEEGQARAVQIRRALEFLGPRDLKAPLFSSIDRRGKAINCWKALSRIAPATKFSTSLGIADEGPWHVPGEWERTSGEQTCGRCGEKAFHLIPECSPSRCPGCGMVACLNCHRNIKLLQAYVEWITSSPGVDKECIFSVVFD